MKKGTYYLQVCLSLFFGTFLGLLMTLLLTFNSTQIGVVYLYTLYSAVILIGVFLVFLLLNINRNILSSVIIIVLMWTSSIITNIVMLLLIKKNIFNETIGHSLLALLFIIVATVFLNSLIGFFQKRKVNQ